MVKPSLLLIIGPPYKLDNSVITPNNIKLPDNSTNVIYVTGFHNQPWYYRQLYEQLLPDQTLVIFETYIPSSIHDLPYKLLDIRTVNYPRYMYDIQLTSDLPNTTSIVAKLVSYLPAPILIVDDELSIEYYRNLSSKDITVCRSTEWPYGKFVSVIDRVPLYYSTLTRRLYLIQQSGYYYCLYSLDTLPYEPERPFVLELTPTTPSLTIIKRLVESYSYYLPWFIYTNLEGQDGYELVYQQRLQLRKYHQRFLGEDDIATILTIWNSLVSEVKHYTNLTIKQWLKDNSLSPHLTEILAKLIADIGPYFINLSEEEKRIIKSLPGAIVQRVDLDYPPYLLKRAIFSEIDLTLPSKLKVIRSVEVDKDNIVLLAIKWT